MIHPYYIFRSCQKRQDVSICNDDNLKILVNDFYGQYDNLYNMNFYQLSILSLLVYPIPESIYIKYPRQGLLEQAFTMKCNNFVLDVISEGYADNLLKKLIVKYNNENFSLHKFGKSTKNLIMNMPKDDIVKIIGDYIIYDGNFRNIDIGILTDNQSILYCTFPNLYITKILYLLYGKDSFYDGNKEISSSDFASLNLDNKISYFIGYTYRNRIYYGYVEYMLNKLKNDGVNIIPLIIYVLRLGNIDMILQLNKKFKYEIMESIQYINPIILWNILPKLGLSLNEIRVYDIVSKLVIYIIYDIQDPNYIFSILL
ncbi:Hypothetical protein ORPV_807 [Orpheovirus IHUMI-LCC2]|uniref:Uncharacterized protein n=1 Tax=Orpheovirus IHUMI-LCC2 TaxID=2023057 RepID=A0A2I2L5C1_9VIRU|nr:Hypothetical protein ORPV_807 [Orpheovirus IHUMI-LCC2]SNW62711.1 Hypothetical protein ORPV_807 [Orpheovirus IHUMI-LCC2]